MYFFRTATLVIILLTSTSEALWSSETNSVDQKIRLLLDTIKLTSDYRMRVELGLRLDRVIFDANRSDIGLATNASRPDIGRATIDEITLMLKDEATEPYAAGALGLIGPSASSAIPALEEALIRATISDARVAQEFGIYPPSSVGDYVCPALRKIGANPEPPHCDGDNYKR